MESNGDEFTTRSLFQRIQAMSVAEKIDLAHKAGKDARTILIRDSNKLVQLAVVQSPKITESEILAIAANRQVSDEVLKEIGMSKEWLKNYQVRLALVNNPKTPLSIALAQIPYLNKRDLGLLAKNRNVPRPVVVAAEGRLREVKR
ncbi:MAG TPA: hypothetical protein PLS81_01850 [Deltaproteobacteria bacterium]|nr:hypothetical protein [Deltaproteobacteria bacterium]HOM28185.1 hypothetical protein [Deltaproteobacteria bacterium]